MHLLFNLIHARKKVQTAGIFSIPSTNLKQQQTLAACVALHPETRRRGEGETRRGGEGETRGGGDAGTKPSPCHPIPASPRQSLSQTSLSKISTVFQWDTKFSTVLIPFVSIISTPALLKPATARRPAGWSVVTR